jgi:hypothetical protein
MPREFAKIAFSIGKVIKERRSPEPLPEHFSALLGRLAEHERRSSRKRVGTKKKPRTLGAGLLRKLGGVH